MAYMRDYRASRLDAFDPIRDVPGIVTWLDASTLTGSNGDAISRWADLARGRTLLQATTANQPTLKLGAQGGLNTLLFGATAGMVDATFGADFSEPSGGFAQPNTMIAVAKCSSTIIAGTGSGRTVIAGQPSASTSNSLMVASGGATLELNAGSYANSGGIPLNDDTWHVLIGMFGTGSAWMMVDGFLQAAATTQAQGAQPIKGFGVGNNANMSSPFGGEIGEVIIANRQLSLDAASTITAALVQKWSL